MIFICLSPIFLAVNAYYIYEIAKWLTAIDNAFSRECKIFHYAVVVVKYMYLVIWSLASISIYIAFLMPGNISKSASPFLFSLKRTLKMIGNYHLGVFIYMAMALLVIFAGRLVEYIVCKSKKINISKSSNRFNIRRSVIGVIYVTFIVFITLLGVHKAGDIKNNQYEITIHKDVSKMDSMKIAMVADLHLGYNIGIKEMEKMVSLINNQKADIVIVAGDIFDNEYEALEDPDKLAAILSSISSKYGTYVVYGNHDVSEKIIGGFTFNWKDPAKGSSNEMDEFLKKCNFNLLCDEYVLIDDSFYLYGRPDYEKPGKNIITRKTAREITKDLDLSKPVIVIDHEPRELDELALSGVDIDLCGHTHDGQFFPMNLTSRYITWENSAGLLYKDNMANIVTSGVGLFGPNIRIGTQAEVCEITVKFE